MRGTGERARPSRMLVVPMVLAAVLSACASSRDGPRTGDVSGFEVSTVELDGEPLLVALAVDPADRRLGLRGVSDLGDLDGMLFVFEAPVATSFTMRGVPIPLDIAFFDPSGRLIEVVSMHPCERDPCPSYRIDRPFSAALERPAGGFEDVAVGAVLVFDVP